MGPPKGVVLIIDDAPELQRIYKFVLEQDGYKVLQANDGETGLRLARQAQPILILLDLMLPKMGGLQVLKELREGEKTKDLTIVVLSGAGSKTNVEEAITLGADGYYNKGMLTPKELLSKVSETLTRTAPTTPTEATSYKLMIQPDAADAPRLRQHLRLPAQFQCIACGSPLQLEATPDPSHTDGHWFVSHFVCPKGHHSP